MCGWFWEEIADLKNKREWCVYYMNDTNNSGECSFIQAFSFIHYWFIHSCDHNHREKLFILHWELKTKLNWDYGIEKQVKDLGMVPASDPWSKGSPSGPSKLGAPIVKPTGSGKGGANLSHWKRNNHGESRGNEPAIHEGNRATVVQPSVVKSSDSGEHRNNRKRKRKIRNHPVTVQTNISQKKKCSEEMERRENREERHTKGHAWVLVCNRVLWDGHGQNQVGRVHLRPHEKRVYFQNPLWFGEAITETLRGQWKLLQREEDGRMCFSFSSTSLRNFFFVFYFSFHLI